MTIARFDSLNYSNNLKKVGFSDAQSEMLSRLQQESFNSLNTQTISKAELALMRTEISNELAKLENRLTWKILGGIATIFGIIQALSIFMSI